MLLESFEYAEADFAARLLIDARNDAENVIMATEKSLRAPEYAEVAAELKPGERSQIDAALADLKSAVGLDDREAIQRKTQALNDATRHLAEVMMNRSLQAALGGRNVSDM
jgi:molecular chaperone DnaK (HSP70)